MSKNTRKMSFNVDRSEAVIIMTVEFWRYMIKHCQWMATEYPEESEAWLETAGEILFQVEDTAASEGDYDN